MESVKNKKLFELSEFFLFSSINQFLGRFYGALIFCFVLYQDKMKMPPRQRAEKSKLAWGMDTSSQC